MESRTYIAIDLKSFYASVECVERGLDPMTTNLVVADADRTQKTICLAVTPALKSYGIPGRARLFEVVQKVKEVNAQRRRNAPGRTFAGSSYDHNELQSAPELALDYIVAKPQMAHYLECSAKIYNRYLQYIAPEDIHVYSIDEVFMDATPYLRAYNLTARELAVKIILDVLTNTGITATAGTTGLDGWLRYGKPQNPRAKKTLPRHDHHRPLRPLRAEACPRQHQSWQTHILHEADFAGRLRPIRPHRGQKSAGQTCQCHGQPRVVAESSITKTPAFEQLDLFTDYKALAAHKAEEEAELERERKVQQAILQIKHKHGKNAILKGMNLQEGATTVERNNQIGGHKA